MSVSGLTLRFVLCVQLLLPTSVCLSQETGKTDHGELEGAGTVSLVSDHLTITKTRCRKVADTTGPGGFANRGPVAWIGTGETSSMLFPATFGVKDKILHRVYKWNRTIEESPVLIAPIYSRSGLFEFPSSAMWSEKPNGVRIQELPESEHEPVDIESSEKLTDIVAGNKSVGYVIQRRADGTLWVWDISSSTVLHVLKTETMIQKVTISHDGMRIAAVGMPFIALKSDQPLNASCSVLFVWDLDLPAPSESLVAYNRNMGYLVHTLDFSLDDKQLLCTGIDDIFSAEGGRSHITVIEPKIPSWSQSYEFNTFMIMSACYLDNNIVAVGTLDDRILVFDMKQQRVIAEKKAQQEGVFALRMNLGTLLSGGGDGTICEWNISSDQ